MQQNPEARERIIEFIRRNKVLRKDILPIISLLGKLAERLEAAVAGTAALSKNQPIVQAIVLARSGKRKEIAESAAALRTTFCRLVKGTTLPKFSSTASLSELLFDQYCALNGQLQWYLLGFTKVLTRSHDIEHAAIEDKMREFKTQAYEMFQRILLVIKKVKVLEEAALSK